MLESPPMPRRDSQFGERKRTVRLLNAEALWNYALKALGSRALSIGEVRQKLCSKAQDGADVEPTIARLRDYGYLNDAQFAETFATARKDNQGLGRMRVLRDLRQRRVAPAVAETAVRQTFEGTDELELIESYLKRKYRGKELSLFLKEEKNLASAFRRLQYAGFSAGAAIRVLKRNASRADELEPESVDEDIEESL